MTNEIVHIDLFSGIGGFHLGLLDAGFTITDHYFSELDKHAIANYKYNFPHAEYIGSVKYVSGRELRKRHPDATIIVTFGWPCQDNSIAGKRKGQKAGTRSSLLSEAGRIVDESNFLNGKTGDKRSNVLYGKKGDKVELVSTNGNVLIVSNGKNKFSVLKEQVTNG